MIPWDARGTSRAPLPYAASPSVIHLVHFVQARVLRPGDVAGGRTGPLPPDCRTAAISPVGVRGGVDVRMDGSRFRRGRGRAEMKRAGPLARGRSLPRS
jgi:hypothetical protein